MAEPHLEQCVSAPSHLSYVFKLVKQDTYYGTLVTRNHYHGNVGLENLVIKYR